MKNRKNKNINVNIDVAVRLLQELGLMQPSDFKDIMRLDSEISRKGAKKLSTMAKSISLITKKSKYKKEN